MPKLSDVFDGTWTSNSQCLRLLPYRYAGSKRSSLAVGFRFLLRMRQDAAAVRKPSSIRYRRTWHPEAKAKVQYISPTESLTHACLKTRKQLPVDPV